MSKNFLPGEHVWIIERDCDEYAYGISSYMFLASVEGYAIVMPFCDGLNAKEQMKELYEEYLENCCAEVGVFSLCDCYRNRKEAAKAYMEEINEANLV